MKFTYITEADVERRLTTPAVLSAVEDAFRALAAGRAENVPRARAKADGIILHSMSAAADYLGLVGWKQYTTTKQGAVFHVGVYDQHSGQLRALIEANRLGQLRTGATTGIAAKYLTAESSRVLALIGSGWQAESQLEAVLHVRPIEKVLVYSRDPQKRNAFAERMSQRLSVRIDPADSSEAAVREADLIVTATSSRVPVLQYQWLRGDQFVAAVGSNWLEKAELDAATVGGAQRVVCDSVEACRREAGELAAASSAGTFDWSRALELSTVVARSTIDPSPGLTIFKSVGMALEDLAVAALLLR